MMKSYSKHLLNLKNYTLFRYEGVKLLYNAVQYLINAVKPRILSDHFSAIFTSIMYLFLKTLSRGLKSCESPANVLDEGLEFTNDIVKYWIAGIVGGDMFGKDYARFTGDFLLKQREEFEVRGQ